MNSSDEISTDFMNSFGLERFLIYLRKTNQCMKRGLLLMMMMLGALTFASLPGKAIGPNNPSTAEAQSIRLGQNYPNPANGKTIIDVSFTSSEATLTIYNVLGKVVDEISVIDKRVVLDVTNYPEGVYLYTLEADGEKLTRRMTVRK